MRCERKYFCSEMARVYDLEPFLEPNALGCDKARICIEVSDYPTAMFVDFDFFFRVEKLF